MKRHDGVIDNQMTSKSPFCWWRVSRLLGKRVAASNSIGRHGCCGYLNDTRLFLPHDQSDMTTRRLGNITPNHFTVRYNCICGAL